MTIAEEIEVDIDVKDISKVIERRIVGASPSLKYMWPKLLQDAEPLWAYYFEDGVFLLYFLNYELIRYQNQFQHTIYGPLPGLFAPESDDRAIFDIEDCTFMRLRGNTASNLHILGVGDNCTVVVEDHPVNVIVPDYGLIDYVIPLAYVVSTGSEISASEVVDKLDDLIAFSIKNWSVNAS